MVEKRPRQSENLHRDKEVIEETLAFLQDKEVMEAIFVIQGTTEDSFAKILARCCERCAVTEDSMLHLPQRHPSGNLSIDLICNSKYLGKRVTHEKVWLFRLFQEPHRLLVDVTASLLKTPDAACINAHLQKLLDEIRTFYGDRYSEGITEPQADSGEVAEQATAAEDEVSSLIKILFLAANPADIDHLRLDAEMRAIDLALQQTTFRDRFDLKQHWAVQVTDLQHYLLRHQPDIVHFSGHGSVSSEIILEDVSGNSRPVSVRALSTLFSILKDNIKCVVLNTCYSEQQAQAIAQSINCVIGMSKAIGDDAAIGFATAFYQALGFGRDVKTAFELGCVQIDLEGLDEQDTPKLLAMKISPENILFIKQAQ